jgi:hypothetical protein
MKCFSISEVASILCEGNGLSGSHFEYLNVQAWKRDSVRLRLDVPFSDIHMRSLRILHKFKCGSVEACKRMRVQTSIPISVQAWKRGSVTACKIEGEYTWDDTIYQYMLDKLIEDVINYHYFIHIRPHYEVHDDCIIFHQAEHINKSMYNMNNDTTFLWEVLRKRLWSLLPISKWGTYELREFQYVEFV